MNGPIYLGVDGGGTKTAAVAYVGDGEAVSAVGHGGPANIAAVPVAEAVDSIRTAVETAIGAARFLDVASLCAGVAGYSHEENRADLSNRLARLFPNASVTLVPDYVIAFDGALSGQPGIIVIAGTGQIAYGENRNGDSKRAGGYGYLIDDAGSGYGVGRAVLLAALEAWDGNGPPTLLTELVADELNLSGTEAIVGGVYGGSLPRTRIASLSRLASVAADSDDDMAVGILRAAGYTLARLALAVRTGLFEDDDEVRIVRVGSLWEAQDSLTNAFEGAVRGRARSVSFDPPMLSPEHGAALRARRASMGTISTASQV